MSDSKGQSRIREDGLGPDFVEPFDGSGANNATVAHDGVRGSSPRGSGRSVYRRPDDGELVAVDLAVPLENRSGDDPFDVDKVDAVSGSDLDPTGVLGADGVDAVHDVAANDPGTLLELGGREARGEEEYQGEGPLHVTDSTGKSYRWLKALVWVVAGLVAAVMAFAIFEPVQVLPRLRVAPGFSLSDQAGAALTSEDGRGAVTLYAFMPSDCGPECDDINQTMRDVQTRLDTQAGEGDPEFNMVTVALDSPSSDELSASALAAGADGERWRWVTADEEQLRSTVGDGFRVYFDVLPTGSVEFDRTFVIVDGEGLIRGEYTYSTIASDADRITRHMGLLFEEIRNSDGNTALLYEAAHVFLCYP